MEKYEKVELEASASGPQDTTPKVSLEDNPSTTVKKSKAKKSKRYVS